MFIRSILARVLRLSHSFFHLKNSFLLIKMAPSASKQKRLAEKAAKAASKTGSSKSSVTGASTPLTSVSDDPTDAAEQMKKLNLATDRSAVCRMLFSGCKNGANNLIEWCFGFRSQGTRHQDRSVYAFFPRSTVD